MERDLSDVLNASLAEREHALAGLEPGADRVLLMRARIRRRRAARHTVQAIAVAPVVAAVVAAVVALGGGFERHAPAEPSPPLPTPSPSVETPDPVPPVEPEPEPDPEPDAGPVLGDPVLERGVPVFHELPDGVVDQAGPGWFLVLWQVGRQFEEGTAGGTTVLLVDPDGVRFRVAALPESSGGPGAPGYRLVAWEPGSPSAVLLDGDEYRSLDLRTGELGPVDPSRDGVLLAGHDLVAEAPGARLWHPHGSADVVLTRGEAVHRFPVASQARTTVEVSPDGRRALVVADGVTVIDLEAATVELSVPEAATTYGWCRPLGWWANDAVLQRCTDAPELGEAPIGAVRLVVADLAALGSGGGTVLRDVDTAEGLPAIGGAGVRPGVVAAPALEDTEYVAHACFVGVRLDDESGNRLVPLPESPTGVPDSFFRVASAAGRVVVQHGPGCAGEAGLERLTTFDPQTGAVVEVTGSPVEDDGRYTGGPVSWLVGR